MEVSEILSHVKIAGVIGKDKPNAGKKVILKGIGFSYGIAENMNDADRQLNEHKAERQRTGLRSAKGTEPKGAVIGRGGRENNPRRASAKKEEPARLKIQEALLEQPEVQQRITNRFASAEEAISHLGDAFGPGISRLVENGILNFSKGKEGWPVNPEKYSAAEAVYLKGRAFIDINAISKERLTAVVLHEIGEHFNLRRMLGTKAYQALQNQIANQAKIPGSLANLTWNKILNGVDANGNKPYAHMGEGSEPFIAEVIAKLGEYAPQAPWYKRLLSQIKSFLISHGLGRGFIAGTMTENDLHDLLKVSLQSATKMDSNTPREFGGVQFSAPVKTTENSEGKPLGNTPEAMSNFWNWFGDSEVVDADGKPLVVYHGMTANFSKFDSGYSNIEGDFGAGFYFTNEVEDVGENYAGIGPDLKNKIATLAERINQESDDEISLEDAETQAKERYMQHEGMTLPVYLRMKNPVILDDQNSTFLGYSEEYDEDTEEYAEPTGTLVDFVDGLRDAASDFESADAEQAIADIFERVGADDGGIRADELIALLRTSEGLMYSFDPNTDSASIAANEIIRRAFEQIGFDGVIDKSVDTKFGSQKRIGAPMAGMNPDTVHYIAFSPNQVKSALGNSGAFDTGNEDIMFSVPIQTEPAPRFYSALSKAIEKAPEKVFGNAQQVKVWLVANAPKFDVKKDEVYWSGITDWLDSLTGKVTRAQVSEFLDANGVKVEDKVLGNTSNSTLHIAKYNEDYAIFDKGELISGPYETKQEAREAMQMYYGKNPAKHGDGNLVLPGGTDYRELVVTIPTTEPYNQHDTTHFGDIGQGKQIGWIRHNTRIDANGNKVLFLEEVQSQRSQAGRKSGFGSQFPRAQKARLEELRKFLLEKRAEGEDPTTFPEWKEFSNLDGERMKYANPIPAAPFVTDSNNKATNAYISLLMKKAVSQAIDNGSDSVAWTTGDQQADRYDLSQHINRIRYVNRDGKFDIVIFDKNDNDRDTRFSQTPEQLEEYLGKGVADKILNDEGQSSEESVGFEPEDEVSPIARELSGLDLKVGGDWAQAMYGDENGLNAQGKPALITQAAGDIARKMGGKLGNTLIKLDRGGLSRSLSVLGTGAVNNGYHTHYTVVDNDGRTVAGPFTDYDTADNVRYDILAAESKGFRQQPALIITPEMKAKILSEGMPMFSTPVNIREAVGRLPEGAARSSTIEMLNAFENLSNTLSKEKLAFLSVRQIIEIAKKYLPGLKDYEEAMQRRRAMVDPYLHRANQITSIKWKALPIPVRKEVGRLMQQSTLRDINASKDWLGVEAYRGRFKAYSMTEFSGESRSAILATAERDGALFSDKNSATFDTEDKAIRFLVKLREIDQRQTQKRAANGWKDSNVLRRKAYANLKPAYDALIAQHPSAEDIYTGTYALHTEIFNARLQALEDRIEESILDARTGAQLIAQLRTKFESQSLSWYYAPLKRYGDHWFYGKDANGEKWFLTYESEPARDRALKNFRADGGTVNENDQGTSLSDIQNSQIGDAVSDNFLKDIHNKIAEADIASDVSKELQDEIHQMYLATLPDISVRHNSMHRKGTLGFDEDAMRAFANTIHHGASQLANMTEGREMAQALADGQRALDIALRTSLREQVQAETEAAAMLQANWDELNDENVLEQRLISAEDPHERQVYEEAIKLQRKFGASEDALNSLGRVENKNTIALEAAKNISVKDRSKAANVLQELRKTYSAMVNTSSTGMDQIAAAIRQFDFVMTMGFGLSSGLVNLFQTPVVAMPIAFGKYGVQATHKAFGKTRNEFLKAVIGFNKKNADGEYIYRDEDGNISISTIMREKLDYLRGHNGDPAEMLLLVNRLAALQNFKEEGDVSRTNFFDVLGIGREGEDYGGRLQEFNKKMGWMFHHGERMNREITLMAAYDLALQGDVRNHLAAMNYARKVNNDAHGDYSSENAARIFRGPVAGVVLQYKKYPQAMLYLWGKTAADTFSGWKKMPETTPEEKAAKLEAKEAARRAARSLSALFVMQGAAAGLFGMPLMGAITIVLNAIGNAVSDDDEPWDVEKELRLGLTELGGETFATATVKGLANALTPVNLSSRMNLSNVFFQEPLKDLEGRDAATEYLSQTIGPFGGMLKKIADGIGMISEGHIWRGIESATPKALGDGMKAIRLAQEGYETLDEEQLKDASAMEVLFQAIGLGSSNMEVLYTERGYAKAAEASISEARIRLVNKIQKAISKGEPIPREELAKWQAKHPTWPITYESIHKSIVRTAKNKQEKGIRGYAVNPRLAYLYEQNRLRKENED